MNLSIVMKYVKELLQLKPPARIETQLEGVSLKAWSRIVGGKRLINIHIYEEEGELHGE